MRQFPWVLTLVVVPAVTLLVGLGVWQMQRLGWKTDLIAEAEAAASRPVGDAATALRAGEFARLSLDCPGLSTAPFVELRSIQDGQSGARLISACRPDDGAHAFLVDRGFIADDVTARPPVAPSDLPTRIEGQLRDPGAPNALTPPASDRLFYARDTAAMAGALGVADVQPLTVFATTSTNPDFPALSPSAPPAAFSNNHLGYAITWFGLAIVLVGFYVALVRRQLKKDIP